VSHTELEVWQRPQQRQYFQPSPTSYYETTRRRKYSIGAVVAGVVGAIGADGILGWAAWSAHQACIHGNVHSIAAEAIVGAASSTSAVLAGFGFASKTDRGSWAGTLLTPVSLVLAGFGVLLWAPGWPASMVTALMEGVLDAGLAAVGIKFGREERKFNHEAGMQHDQIAGGLQKNLDSEEHETERTRIKHRAWFEIGHDADRRADRVEYDLHVRHPDIVAAPERYTDRQPSRELPAAAQPLAITSGGEPADDWMAIADGLRDNARR
jgi:hypothetical protein